MLLAISPAEFDLIAKALAVAGKSETGTEMAALGNALEPRAALGGEALKMLTAATHALRSYQYSNASTELAAGVADACDALMARIAVLGQ